MSITKADIEKIEQVLIEAIKKSNLLLIDKMIHDDLLCLAPNGATITKAMDMASHRRGDMIVDELHSTAEDIRLIDSDTAVSIIIYDTKGKMLGNPIAGKFKYIRVWKRFDKDLKVIAASCIQLV